MADKVYPSRTSGGGPPPFPATKSQFYPNNGSAYRPGPRRSRSRGCCRTFCCCLFFTLLVLILALGVAAAVVYFLYHPHRPSFSVTSLKLSTFNISSASTLTSRFDINITARNANKKISYYYYPTSISIYTKDGIDVGDGSLPGFVHGTENTTLLSASVASSGHQLDSSSVSSLKSEAKTGIPLVVKLDTEVKVKMGSLKTPKVGIRITCEGIKANVPSGNATATASTAGARCKVRSRVKIWKWTI